MFLGREVTFRERGDGVGQFVRHVFDGLGVAIFRSQFQLNGVDGSAGTAAVCPDDVAAGVVWALGVARSDGWKHSKALLGQLPKKARLAKNRLTAGPAEQMSDCFAVLCATKHNARLRGLPVNIEHDTAPPSRSHFLASRGDRRMVGVVGRLCLRRFEGILRAAIGVDVFPVEARNHHVGPFAQLLLQGVGQLLGENIRVRIGSGIESGCSIPLALRHAGDRRASPVRCGKDDWQPTGRDRDRGI